MEKNNELPKLDLDILENECFQGIEVNPNLFVSENLGSERYMTVEYDEKYKGEWGLQLYHLILEIDSKYDIKDLLEKYKVKLCRS